MESIIHSLIYSKHIVSADSVQVPGRGLWEAPRSVPREGEQTHTQASVFHLLAPTRSQTRRLHAEHKQRRFECQEE